MTQVIATLTALAALFFSVPARAGSPLFKEARPLFKEARPLVEEERSLSGFGEIRFRLT